MKIHCPKCDNPLPPDDINVARDTALCRQCNEVYVLSDLVESDEAADDGAAVDLANPPARVTVESSGTRMVLTCQVRQLMGLFFLVFGSVWLVFVFGMFSSAVARGPGILFALLFPLAGGWVILWGLFLLRGRLRVTLDGPQVSVFTGLGPFGLTRRINLAQATAVEIVLGNVRINNRPVEVIQVDGPAWRKRFGWMLSDDQKAFLAAVLRRAMIDLRQLKAGPHPSSAAQ